MIGRLIIQYRLDGEKIKAQTLSKEDKEKLKEIFGTTDLRVEWNEATDTHMKAFYKEKGNQLDLLSGGSGFIQFIQVLSKIWYRQSSLILLDEPDAHLNPNLVYDMIQTLQAARFWDNVST